MKRKVLALVALFAGVHGMSSPVFGSLAGLFLTSTQSGPTGVLVGNTTFNPGNLAPGWVVGGVADFDQDGNSDIVMFNAATGDVYLWLDGGLGPRPYLGNMGASSTWSVFATGDFYGDKHADIIWQNVAPNSPDFGKMLLWRVRAVNGNANVMSSAFLSWPADPARGPYVQMPPTPDFWRLAGTGDFNGDGTSDILWHLPATGEVALWGMKGSRVISNLYIGSQAPGRTLVGIGDFDGDGTADILWYNYGPKTLTISFFRSESVREQRNVTSQGQEVSFNSFPTWSIAGIGDINGDGKSDMFLYNPATASVTGWLMNGYTIPATVSLPAIQPGLRIAGAGNFRGPSVAPALNSWPSGNQTPPPLNLCDPAIAYSPLNWDFNHWDLTASSYVEATQPGAYFSVNFTGTTVGLKIDLTPMQNLVRYYPSIPWPDVKVRYAIDGNVYPDVKLTPGVLSQGRLNLSSSLSPGVHTLKFWYVSNQIYSTPTSGGDRWIPYTSLRIQGLIVGDGARLVSPAPLKSKSIVYFGDSITEGALTVNNILLPGSGEIDKTRIADDNDATQTYAVSSAAVLDADYGIIGNGGQGWNVTSVGNVPPFYQSLLNYSAQSPRSFANEVDYVLVNMGTNDFNMGAYVSGCATQECLQDYIRRSVLMTDPATNTPISMVTYFIQQARVRMPGSQLLILIPFGHWASITNVIYEGVDAYQNKYRSLYGQLDAKVRIVDLQGLRTPDGTDPSLGLTLSGNTYPLFSYDGVHPNARRSLELGTLLGNQIKALPVGPPSSGPRPIDADVRSLTSTNGANGWFGGYLANSTDSDFGASAPSSFVTQNMVWTGSIWLGSELYNTPQVSASFAHPGASTRRSAAWQYVVPSGQSGNATITFRTRLLATGGTGTSIAVWVNNVRVTGYVNNIAFSPVAISVTQNLAAGDVVVFELNARGDSSYDSTTVEEITIKGN